MSKLVRKLPCSIKPKSDELFSSWLVRLAYDHQIKSHSFYRILFPNYNIWNRDIDKLAPEEFIIELENKTISTYSELYQTTLKSFEGKLYLKHNSYGNTKWILPLGINHRTRKNNGLVFCPCCLKKDRTPYFRKHWRLSLSIICVKCGIYLLEKCPNCKKPVIFFRNDLGNRNKYPESSICNCYNCQFNLSDSKITKAPIEQIKQQKELYRIIDEGLNDKIIYPHSYFDVLHQILKLLIGNNFNTNIDYPKNKRYYPCNKNKEQNKSFELLPIELRKRYLKTAIWLLDDFPTRFITISKKEKVKSSTLLKDFNQAPFWFYSVVIENFFVSNVNRQFIKNI